MKKSVFLTFALLSAASFTTPAMAASSLGDSCDLSVLGVRDTSRFYRFDNALREAVTARDAEALAALVQYPIRLNYAGGGQLTIYDAATLRDRHADRLWPILQDAVIGQQPGDLFCNAQGVMYGDGAVWANPESRTGVFQITSLNLQGRAPSAGNPAPVAPPRPLSGNRALLACDTNKFHIAIDTDADGQPRYRSWNLSSPPPAQPAMFLVGDESREGSGVCSHRTWRFRNGNTRYIVSEPGCDAGDTPSNAKARLVVVIDGRPQLESWCH